MNDNLIIKIGKFFIDRVNIAIIITLFLCIWGAFSAFIIPKESAPFIDYGIVNITTVYNGAVAEEVDKNITDVIEKKIKNIDNLNKYSSVSKHSVSSVTLEFDPGTNMIKALSDIRSKMDEVKNSLPDDITDDPRITQINSSNTPFLTIVLSGDYDRLKLSEFANKIKDNVEKINGVDEVKINGEQKEEVHILLKTKALEKYGVTASEVFGIIRNNHRDVPIGEISINNVDYSARFSEKYSNIKELKETVIRLNNGSDIIKLSDLSDIYLTGENIDRIDKFVNLDENRVVNNFVSLTITKKNNGDVFKINSDTKKSVEKTLLTALPKDLKIDYIGVMADVIKEDYDNLINSSIQSFFMVILFIFIFIGIREGLVASLIVPITFLITIGILATTGKTMNFMTNFSMILSLGILVDTAIVIVEGTYMFIKKGYAKKEAALMSLREFSTPLIAGTTTTLAVFIPLLFLPGVMGKYLSFIPITMSTVLVVSLIISLVILPAISSFLLPKNKEENKEKKWIEYITKKYTKGLEIFLHYKKLNIMCFFSIIFLFFLSFKVPIPFSLFPNGDGIQIKINIETVYGTNTNEFYQKVANLENFLLNQEEVKNLTTSTVENKININLELLPKNFRKDNNMRTSIELENEINKYINKNIENNPNFLTKVSKDAMGPPVDSPVMFRIVATDNSSQDTAKEITKKLTEVLRAIPNAISVKNNIERSYGEIMLEINIKKINSLSIENNHLFAELRTMINGINVITMEKDGDDIDVILQYNKDNLLNLDDIGEIRVNNKKGQKIALNQFLKIKISDSLESINRNNGEVSFTVSSNIANGSTTQEVSDLFLKKVESDIEIPESVKIINADENAENADLLLSLFNGLIIAIMMVFLILILQFNSILQSLIILATIFFAQIGVTMGLYITDTPRSMAYIFGIISLIGIIVNDAIILVDKINRSIKNNGSNISINKIIINSAKTRFIPIILTTLTTSAGIIPLIFIDEFWAGLAYTMIFGLSMASLLTLFITPVIYNYIYISKIKSTIAAILFIVISFFAPSFIF